MKKKLKEGSKAEEKLDKAQGVYRKSKKRATVRKETSPAIKKIVKSSPLQKVMRKMAKK